jgi:hypothetical protein
MALLAILVAAQVEGSGAQLGQMLAMLLLPFAVGWLLVQGPLLALETGENYLRVLWRRLPHALIVANLGMAGTVALALPLVNLSLRSCSILPLPPSLWVSIAWWALVAFSALAGGFLLFGYEFWAVRHGYRAWSAVTSTDGDAVHPPWRKVWWWVLLSYVALVGGIAASTVLQLLISA